MDFLKEKFRYIFVLHKHNKVWKSMATLMAGIVVFVTTYSLILPAITIETEVANETAGFYLEENTGSEQTVEEESLSDGLTEEQETEPDATGQQEAENSNDQKSTDEESSNSDSQNPFDEKSGNSNSQESMDKESDNNLLPGAAVLAAQTDKVSATVSNVSGELFAGGMNLSIKELKKDGFEYSAYRPIAQNKASSDEEDPGDWSVCDVRIFDLRYTDADGFETIPAQEMNAEFKLFEHMEAGLCKIVLLTDEQDDLTGDSGMINVDSVMTRNNHTLEITRDENNLVAGFKFKAEAMPCSSAYQSDV